MMTNYCQKLLNLQTLYEMFSFLNVNEPYYNLNISTFKIAIINPKSGYLKRFLPKKS